MADWLLRRPDGEFRARDAAMLCEWALQGKIAPSDYVFNPVLQRWMYASEVRELADVRPADSTPVTRAAKSDANQWKALLLVVAIPIVCIAIWMATIALDNVHAWMTAEPSQRHVNEGRYSPPPEGTKSLISDVQTSRNAAGDTFVSGTALLPRNTKIEVDFFPPGENDYLLRTPTGVATRATIVGFQNRFLAGPFDIPTGGVYDIDVSARFYEGAQTPAVLGEVGTNGARLPRSALIADDPEFPDRGPGHVEYRRTIVVPPPSGSGEAIIAVKSAKLYVQGKGQSVFTVAEIVAYFTRPPDIPGVTGELFYPREWKAEDLGDGRWKVSLSHKWDAEPYVANWEYDSRTKTVTYIDPEAKLLSWLPDEYQGTEIK